MDEGLSKWCGFFTLDPSIPSGLRWATNIYNSRGALTKARVGREAGSLSGQGRYQVQVHGIVYRCHVIIWQMLYGDEIPEGMVIDHEDGDEKNNAYKNLRMIPKGLNGRNERKKIHNTSGVTGVGFWKCSGSTHARAYWVDLDGKQQSKTFSASKYGLLPAFKLACEYRDAVIVELNKQGAGYTARHGK